MVAHFKVPSDKRKFLIHHNMSEAEDIIKVVSPYCIFNWRLHISGCHVDGRKGNRWWVVRGGLWSWNGWVGGGSFSTKWVSWVRRIWLVGTWYCGVQDWIEGSCSSYDDCIWWQCHQSVMEGRGCVCLLTCTFGGFSEASTKWASFQGTIRQEEVPHTP